MTYLMVALDAKNSISHNLRNKQRKQREWSENKEPGNNNRIMVAMIIKIKQKGTVELKVNPASDAKDGDFCLESVLHL